MSRANPTDTISSPFVPSWVSAMSNLFSLVGGGAAGLAGSSVQDLLDKAAPGLGFLPGFMRTWLKVDISVMIGLLSLVGAMSQGVQFLERVAVKLYWWMTRFCTASVSISASDRLNREVLNWLSSQVLTRQGTRILNAQSETIHNSWWYRKAERNDYRHEKRTPVEYLPTFGTTWFIHRFNIFMVRRVPSARGAGRPGFSAMPDEYAAAPDGHEPLVVMCVGRSALPIKRFLEDCRDFSDKQREEFITVRAAKEGYHRWDTTILRPIRAMDTVHFDEAVKADLVCDIENYLRFSTRKFYNQRGIPYRRGYLLHGPPGTGKTSLSLALAGVFGLELYLLHVPSVGSDRELEALFTLLPPRCIVLLEDIDAVGMKRSVVIKDEDENNRDGGGDGDGDEDDEDEDDRRGPPPRSTLSGLLNVLDGVASQEGRIVLMTSNFAEKLDPALVRPGRIDKMIYLGHIDQECARLMFARMYRSAKTVSPDEIPPPSDKAAAAAPQPHDDKHTATNDSKETSGDASTSEDQNLSTAVDVEPERLAELAVEFSQLIKPETFTPAQLQGYLLNHRLDPVKAVEEVEAWGVAELARIEEAKLVAKKLRERRAKKRREKRLARANAANVAVQQQQQQQQQQTSGAQAAETTSAESVEAAVAKAMKGLEKRLKLAEKVGGSDDDEETPVKTKKGAKKKKTAKDESQKKDDEDGASDDDGKKKQKGDDEVEEKKDADGEAKEEEGDGDNESVKEAEKEEEGDSETAVVGDDSEEEGEYTTAPTTIPSSEEGKEKTQAETKQAKENVKTKVVEVKLDKTKDTDPKLVTVEC